MRRAANWLACVVAASFAASAWAEGPCCEKVKPDNGWCTKCNVGYVNGVTIKSEALHKALRGEKTPATIECATCKTAMKENGTCEACHVSFARNLMFHSPVAYRLALGSHKDLEKITCEGCKKNAKGQGWCEVCRVGMVGCCAYSDREQFTHAGEAMKILETAIKATEKCEGCAVATVTDGTCEKDKTSFKDGKKIKG